MKTHTMNLTDAPFTAIASGSKTIESRLYDAKRQEVSLGDEIIFTHAEKPERQVRAVVVGLLRTALLWTCLRTTSRQNSAAKA